jgi:tetratricopeptide (TPR) repeat protein
MAYNFLASGTNDIGYVWYNSVCAGRNSWADMGRTGSAALANYLSPYDDKKYMQRAMLSVKCIGDHPKSFPDTHGCPPLGMVWTALAAHLHPKAFRSVMDYHKWWFTLAQCPDRTFVAQPNRDNGGSYTSAPRLFMSSVVAVIFSAQRKKLHIMGAKVSIEGVNPARLSPNTRRPFELLESDRLATAQRLLLAARKKLKADPDAPARPSKLGVTPEEDLRVIDAMLKYIDARWQEEVAGLAKFEASGDILALSEEVTKLVKTFRGVKGFDEKIASYQKRLGENPWRKEVLAGKAYLGHLGILKRYKSPSAAKKLEKFAQENPDSVYGRWASAVVMEFRERGTIPVSSSGRPFAWIPVAKPKPVAPPPPLPKPKPRPVKPRAEDPEYDAGVLLNMAKVFLRQGKKDIAIARLKEVIKKYPNSGAAKTADELLLDIELDADSK